MVLPWRSLRRTRAVARPARRTAGRGARRKRNQGRARTGDRPRAPSGRCVFRPGHVQVLCGRGAGSRTRPPLPPAPAWRRSDRRAPGDAPRPQAGTPDAGRGGLPAPSDLSLVRTGHAARARTAARPPDAIPRQPALPHPARAHPRDLRARHHRQPRDLDGTRGRCEGTPREQRAAGRGVGAARRRADARSAAPHRRRDRTSAGGACLISAGAVRFAGARPPQTG